MKMKDKINQKLIRTDTVSLFIVFLMKIIFILLLLVYGKQKVRW